MNEHGVLDGIFTCPDVATRIIAKDKHPESTISEQMVTLNPACASPHYTILEPLQRMQACSFRHLPVVEDHSRKVIGLVIVLKLASDALLGTAFNTSVRSFNGLTPPAASPDRRTMSSHSLTARSGGLDAFFSTCLLHRPMPPPPRETQIHSTFRLERR